MHALFWVSVARLLLATGGFKLARKLLRLRTIDEVERAQGAAPRIEPDAGRALHIAMRVCDATRASCMPRSIALERICVANGIAPEMVIGVDRSNGFKAHAWIELDGYPLGIAEIGRAQWTALGRFRSARTEDLS
jgi:hypothetical protein